MCKIVMYVVEPQNMCILYYKTCVCVAERSTRGRLTTGRQPLINKLPVFLLVYL